MEPISQGLLGAAVGQVVAGRKLGRDALLFGALVAMSPDLDVLVAPLDRGFGEWVYHRGATHSLWFGCVFGPIMGVLLWRFRGRRPGDLSAWVWMCVLALITHPLLDGFTPYGTQLFAPFSRARFAWHGVGVVDPFYTVILLAAILCATRTGWPEPTRRRVTLAALVLSTAYLLVGVGLNEMSRQQVRGIFEGSGGRVASVRAYPTLLQPLLRRVVVRMGDKIWVGLHTMLRPECLRGSAFDSSAADPRVVDLLATREGRILSWFAQADVAATFAPAAEGGTRVRLEDLRYGGLVGPPDESMWGVEADYDAEGERRGEVQRFSRMSTDRVRFDLLWPAMAGEKVEGLSSLSCDPAATHVAVTSRAALPSIRAAHRARRGSARVRLRRGRSG